MSWMAGCAGVMVALAAAAPPPPSHGSVRGLALGDFRAVSAASATDVWAVGETDSPVLRSLAARWSGTHWVRVPTPDFGTGDNVLFDVMTLSPSDAWAVGSYRTKPVNAGVARTLVLHWDGARWERVSSPNPGRADAGLAGISAVSASDIWAVGKSGSQELVEHWDGQHWAAVPSPHVSDGGALNDVSAVSASDIWAVGCSDFDPGGATSSNLMLHWNGHRWASAAVPTLGGNPPSSCLTGVSAQSGSNGWAVGNYSPQSSPVSKTLVLHWNGHRWAPVPTPAPGGSLESELNDVTAISPAIAWVAGDVFNGDNQSQATLIMQWNGSRWTRQASSSPGFSTLYGVSAVSGSAAWAVGYDGSGSLALHWNGTRWAPS